MRWFIALRYFFSHKRQSLVCIAGVTISVTMFIAMDAMMQGFREKFIIETVESSGHITVYDEPRETRTKILELVYTDPNALLVVEGVKPRDKTKQIKNPTGLVRKIRALPGIDRVAPMVTGDAIATYGTKTMNIAIHGIDPEAQVRATTIGEKLTAGEFSDLKKAADGVIVGRGIAHTLGARVGDSIVLSSPSGGTGVAKIVGVFATGVTPVDYGRAYMLLNNAQALLDKKNIINQVLIRTDDYTRAEGLAAQIESIGGYRTESWQETNENFLKIFKIQDMITYIITGSLLIVAAFGVLNILVMAVLERVNDIAILKSFGFSRRDIRLIYMCQGLVIGLIGASVGLVAAKLVIEGLRRVPIQMEGLVKAEGLLMAESPRQYAWAFVAAVMVVILASVYPASRAAKYDPVEVIRGAH